MNNEISVRNENEIDLIDLFKILLKNKSIIIGITILVFIISCITVFITNEKKYSTRAIIAYSYSEISDGKNPDGTRFSTSQIKNILILRRVYEMYPVLASNNIDIREFGKSIEISGITPDNILKQAETSLKQGIDYKYNPTSYNINFKLTNNRELDIKILNTYLEEYISEFLKKYNNITNLPKFEKNKLESYDLAEQIELIEGRLNQLIVRTKEDEKQSFISFETGYNYSDINQILLQIKNIELKNLESEINVQNLSKNIVLKRLILLNKIDDLVLERDLLIEKSLFTKEMLKDYKPSNRQMIVPTLGEMGIKISTEEEYYSNLINDYKEYRGRISEINIKIKDYQKDSLNLKNIEQDDLIKIEEKLSMVIDNTNTTIELLNLMNKEYLNKKYSEIVRVVASPQTIGTSYGKLLLLAGLILGVILGITTALIKEFTDKLKNS